jgi:hypothetical protein
MVYSNISSVNQASAPAHWTAPAALDKFQLTQGNDKLTPPSTASLHYEPPLGCGWLLRMGAFGLVDVDADEQGAPGLHGNLCAGEFAQKKAREQQDSLS